jgi:hypothetical protein
LDASASRGFVSHWTWGLSSPHEVNSSVRSFPTYYDPFPQAKVTYREPLLGKQGTWDPLQRTLGASSLCHSGQQ